VPRGDGCRLCAPGAVLQASFAALHNEVDYSRYCFAACHPLSSKEDAPCEERDNSQEAQTQLLRAPKTAAPAAAPAAPLSASELEHTGEVAAESLAEVALLRAQRHAREAKQSAALARYAYEKLAKSREEASEAAGQAALEDVILDARKDAGEAVKIRAGWEDAARAHAAQKAVVAAAVYKKAKLRDLQVAEAWEKQATLLLKTSRQYEEYAARQEMKEKKLKQALKKLEAKEAEPTSLLEGVAAPAPAPFRVEEPVLSKSLEPIPQVAQAPMAAFAPPPATASGMVEGIAQAPVAAAAPPPASATGPSGMSDATGSHAKAEPSITSAAAPAPASAVEVEGSKLESKEEGKEEKSKEEGKKESKKESKKETKEDKSKEGKEKSKEEKSKKDGKEKSEEKRESEAKAASAAVPVAPAPAASPSAASIASSAIFGNAAKTPLVPFGGPQDEKSRLLQELQVAEAQVDAGLKLAHEYELQAHAARKEAEGIRANASWYDGAEAAAAAHTLYAELPKGVIPPPLPALP